MTLLTNRRFLCKISQSTMNYHGDSHAQPKMVTNFVMKIHPTSKLCKYNLGLILKSLALFPNFNIGSRWNIHFISISKKYSSPASYSRMKLCTIERATTIYIVMVSYMVALQTYGMDNAFSECRMCICNEECL